jgi:hypothetical protein
MDCQGANVALQQILFQPICLIADPGLTYLIDMTINDSGKRSSRGAPIGFLLRCNNI